MSKQSRGLRAVLKELAQSSEHSPLFWYMREHYAEMAAATAGRRVRWLRLCAKFADQGLTDGEGKSPSTESARRTWRHVRAEVAKERSYQLTGVKPARQQPSRAPATWQPPVVQPQSLTPAPEPTSARGDVPKPTADPDDPLPGSMAYVRRQLEKLSGR